MTMYTQGVYRNFDAELVARWRQASGSSPRFFDQFCANLVIKSVNRSFLVQHLLLVPKSKAIKRKSGLSSVPSLYPALR